jgi:hypothetical protein
LFAVGRVGEVEDAFRFKIGYLKWRTAAGRLPPNISNIVAQKGVIDGLPVGSLLQSIFPVTLRIVNRSVECLDNFAAVKWYKRDFG